MLDSQGRLALGREICTKYGFYDGMKIMFVLIEKMKYKIIPSSANVGETVAAEAEYKDDGKYRITVPASIRRNYTKHSIITCDGNGNLYLNFFELS